MVSVSLKLLKKLREETSASVADCRRALEECGGNYQEALVWLKQHGLKKADKKSGRETSQGLIDSYIHQNGRVGALVKLLCETDFVARTGEFKQLAHELCMQVAAMNPADVDSLLKQEYIRDSSITVSDLVKSVIAKLGENIKIKRFQRFEIGQ
ncbi:translation elongation factor Ts [Candidatus Microgenomates bacterium]|nr:translation elongation factor Ts [Candidatus Microgenomates bacterium]